MRIKVPHACFKIFVMPIIAQGPSVGVEDLLIDAANKSVWFYSSVIIRIFVYITII